MRLIVEPEAGDRPLIDGIRRARVSVSALIFRLDCRRLLPAFAEAIGRGVAVHVLIANKHRGGRKDLRRLERRLLHTGASVARTSDDLVRYHGKMMIVDERELHLYGFNCTSPDLRSRSFGISTTDRELVTEARRLFVADSTRALFKTSSRRFVVSPINSRRVLAEFIRGARRQLLIYDPRLSDHALHRLLTERAESGIDVRVIGRVRGIDSPLAVAPYAGGRLHVRCIVRDGACAFVGSQSLGRVALDRRREVGVIVGDHAVVRQLRTVFERDWRQGAAPARRSA